MRSFSSRVFRYAVATARASVDPAQPLHGALVSPVAKHHAAITDPIAFGKLLRSIETCSGQPVTKLALRLTPHAYQRPGEVRKAEWSEIDFGNALWAIPAERMKQRQPHRVPLSRQALAILREAAELSGGGRYVFPKLGYNQPDKRRPANVRIRPIADIWALSLLVLSLKCVPLIRDHGRDDG